MELIVKSRRERSSIEGKGDRVRMGVAVPEFGTKVVTPNWRPFSRIVTVPCLMPVITRLKAS